MSGWSERPEGGGRLALSLVCGVVRRGGRGIGRVLLYPITAYFLLVRGPERRASRRYLARVLGRPAGPWQVARHIHAFAATILDRVFLLGGELHRFRIRVEGLAALRARMDEGRGVLVLGSHLGSFDALRVLAAQAPDARLRVVLDVAHNPVLTALLGELNPALAAGIIDAGGDGTGVALAIGQALDEGALVALLADRARPGEAVQAAPFLGAPAPFPLSPWLLAAALGVPVVLAFGLYEGGNRYRLVFEDRGPVPAVPRGRRRQALAPLIADYAARLEHHARAAPYNWFNFYDFWTFPDADASLPRVAGAAAGRPGRPAARRPA